MNWQESYPINYKNNLNVSTQFFRIFDVDTFKLLRLPFSFFLMPVFWFAYSQANHPDLFKSILVFVVLHFLIYPASNAYNSFMDQDEGPIGGLEYPPKATKNVYYLSILFDVLGLIIAFFVSAIFGFGVLLYILASKAYSYKGIRLKKYPIISWVVAIFFQGAFTYFLVLISIQNNSTVFNLDYTDILAGLACSILLGGIYPLTQIYQHEEDAQHGDLTLSRKLGILKTIYFSGGMFLLSALLFYAYFNSDGAKSHFYFLQLFLLPSVIYFAWWYIKIKQNTNEANYTNTMRMVTIAASGANACFIFLSFY